MDCEQVIEILDAYALQATAPGENKAIEEHVADCVRCWDELNTSQRTAALLALSVPIQHASPRLEARVMSQARRDVVGVRTEPRAGVLRRLRFSWPAATAVLGTASLAAFAFAGALQMQVNDVRDENDALQAQLVATQFNLQQQLEVTDSQLQDQRTISAVLSDSDKQEVAVKSSTNEDAGAYYTWSSEARKGFLVCDNMPSLPPGKVYQLWFTVEGKAYPMRAFNADNGTCQVPMDLGFLDRSPSGIGISIETMPGGAERPTGGWLLYRHFSSD